MRWRVAAGVLGALLAGAAGTAGALRAADASAAALLPSTPAVAAHLPLAGSDQEPATGSVALEPDPDAVVIRVPDRDYGSGYHGDYGMYRRETSAPAELRAAAAARGGCLIIGDSIATYVVQDLVAELRRTSGQACAYDTWPGRATEGTANALLDLKRRYGLPARVIVMSGTNDIFNPPLFEHQMNRLIDGIGPDREILWVSTFDSRRPATAQSSADERNTAWINGVLQDRAARTPNLRIVRWDSLFRGEPHRVEALLSDGVHPNAAGIGAMVDLVRASLAAAHAS